MSTAAKATVQVRHRFRQTAERVFDAWLHPATAVKFLFASGTGTVVRCDIDARVGRRFAVVDRRPEDGDVLHEGEYLEIDRPRRLVFTFGVPKYSPEVDVVTVEITPRTEGCELVLTHRYTPAPEWPEDSVVQGWTGIINGLERALD